MAAEKQFQRRMIRVLERECGAVCFTFVGNVFQKAGIPDVFIGHPLWTGWLECKGPRTKIQPIQIHQLKKLLRCNVPAYSARWKDPDIWFHDYELDVKHVLQNWDGSGWSILQFLVGIA